MQLYAGHTLLVSSPDGIVRGDGYEGLYHHNTRVIERWRHFIDGQEPKFVSASPVDAWSMLAYYVAPHVLQQVPGLKAEEKGLVLQVNRFIGDGMHEDISLRNYTATDVKCAFAWDVASDFADLAEAQEGRRRQQGEVRREWRCAPDGARELVLRYLHEGLDREAVVRFPAEGGEPRVEDDRVVYDVRLAPREERRFCVTVTPIFDGSSPPAAHDCPGFHRGAPARERFLSQATQLRAANRDVQQTWDRAVRDLADLALGDGEWPESLTPAAGVPAYQALFGRDTVTAAWQAAMAQPVIMEATLASVARHIGRERNDFYDEEPGRVVQQVNLSPLAMLGITPFRRYYGDFAAPMQFLTTLGQSYMWTGDASLLERYYDDAERVMRWIDERADGDADGFVEYDTKSPLGQKNQGWKDSAVALVYEDGRGVENPIATCELQGYVYVARQQYAAAIAMGLHKFGEARRLLHEASKLKRQFDEAFWMEPEGFIPLALDREKRLVRSISSNPGHCLATGIVSGERARRVAERLMAPDMFSGWGIRTLSSEHPSFNPFSYQLGAVWPVETATIAFGMKRYGFHDLCNELAGASFAAAGLFPHHRLPEVLGGDQRDEAHPHPGVYPQAESPQAWSASSIPLLIQAMLGLRPVAPLRVLLIDPVLPEWLPRLALRGLRVGSATVSLEFHRRRDGGTSWNVTEKRGPLRVVQQAPESSTQAGLLQRGRDAVRSFVPAAH
jgi:glycogen debranching enzyme